MKLSTLSETLPGSQILAISNAIRQRMQSRETIYNFTVGDFDPHIFPIPLVLEEEIINAYLMEFTNYPLAEGNLDLREAISSFTSIFQGLTYNSSEVLVGSGGRPLIYALYRTIIDPGDNVIYPVPSWNNHYYTKFVGGIPIEIETTAENNFMPTAEQIAPHVKDAVLLALCSPQNPTGTCFSEHSLKAICELVLEENKRRLPEEKKLYILFDQMYWLLTHGTSKHHDPVSVCPDIRPYVVYVDAISKSFAATGLRVGWVLGPSGILNKMKAILTHVGAWAPMAEQKAVAIFLEKPEAIKEYLQAFKSEVVRRLQTIYDGILSLKNEGLPVDAIAPQAAIYLTFRIDLPEAQRLLLDEAKIGILPFAVFGASNDSVWYRISVGTCKNEDIAPMLEKFKKAICHITTTD